MPDIKILIQKQQSSLKKVSYKTFHWEMEHLDRNKFKLNFHLAF